MAQRSAAVEKTDPLAHIRAMRPIDLVHLAKQCLGDENLEQEILRLFDTTVKTYFGRLEMAVSYDDLAINLHSIKGAAGGVGAWTIADLAKGAEAEMQAGRPLTTERIADLGMAIEEARIFISRMLSKEPA